MIYLKTGLIPLNLAYDDDIVQEANGLYQLTFKFPKSDELSHLLKEETKLVADDLHGEQEFFVFEVKKSLDHVTVYANQVATLLNSYAISTISVDRVPGQTVMTALAGSVVRSCPFSFASDVAGRHTLNLSHVSVMDALAKGKHSIIGQWGGDLVRDKYSIRLLANGGADNQSLFMYRKNLSQFGQERSIKDLRTRIHFRKVIKGQGEGAQDQVLSVTVDSPLIGQYSQIYEATMTVEDQDVTDETSLRAYGQAYYGKTLCDLPEESMELAVVGEPDTPVRLYDVVSVLYDDYGIDLRLKISKYRYAPMSKRLKSIGFGKVGQTLGGAIGKVVSNQVEEAKAELVDEFDHKLQKQIDNANAAFDAEFGKAKQVIEDGIEEAKAAAEVVRAEIGAEVEAVALEGQAVKQAVDAGLAEADRKAKAFESDVRDRVALVETKANQVADQARQADQKAAQALTRAGASQSLAQTAKDTADRAIRQAGDNLRTAQERANQLLADLDTANRSITSQARDILAQAQAQSELTTMLQTVETTANGTKTTVTELSKTLNTATGNLASVTQRVASTEMSLAGVRDQYSQLSQTVSGQTGQITAMTRQTADLQRGLDGVTERFETAKIGTQNLVANSKINESSNAYGFGFRTVNLVAGTNYWFAARAKLTGGTAKSTNIYLYYPDWSQEARLLFTQTAYEVQSIRFVPRQTGTYWIQSYWFPRDGDRSGTADVDWYMVTESDLAPTTWSAAEEDIRQELATYIRTATENTARLEQSIQTADGKAEGAKTLARQTAQGLALKAEKTYVDDVKSTADSAKEIADGLKVTSATKTELKVVSDVITQLATKTEVNGVTGRLTTAEASIRTQAEQIAQRLTSTQVETAITAKGYQTKDQVDANITGRGYITNAALAGYVPTTTFNNYKTETAQSIELGLTATRALIPTEVGGRNYLLNSNTFITNGYRSFALSPDFVKHATGGKSIIVSFEAEANSLSSNGGAFTRLGFEISATLSNGRIAYYNCWLNGLDNKARKRYSLVNPKIPDELAITKINYCAIYVQLNGQVEIGKPKVEIGDVPTDYSPAPEDMVTSVDFNRVRETAELYEQVIGRSEGDIQTNVARQVLTSQLYQTEVKSPLADMATRLTQLNDSYAIQVLGSSSRILTEINANASGLRLAGKLIHLDGTVTANDAFFRSILADKIETGNIKAGAVTTAKIDANAVTADKLLVNQALIDKLVTNSLWADRLFAQSAFMANLQATKILAGQIDAGLINTAMLATDAVTADKLVVNQALFTKLMANEAYLRQLFAKQAFITQVQSVELSASRIKSGVLQAINGAMSINLDQSNVSFNHDATIDFNSAQNALKRVRGGVTGFVQFSDDPQGGVYANFGVSSHNVGLRYDVDFGKFAGLRVQRASDSYDSVKLYGDTIDLRHGTTGRAYVFRPTRLQKNIDINSVINMVLSLAQCFKHIKGNGWDLSKINVQAALADEIDTFMTTIDTYKQNRIHRG